MGRRRTPCSDQWSLVLLDELCGGICHKKGGTLSEMSISDVCLLVFGSQGPSLVPRETEAGGMARWLGAFSFYAVQWGSPLTEWVSVSVAGCGGRRLALRFSKSHPVFRSGCLTLQDSRGRQNCPEGMFLGECWVCGKGRRPAAGAVTQGWMGAGRRRC